jgi:hypothetical protein
MRYAARFVLTVIILFSAIGSADTHMHLQGVDENGDGNHPDLFTNNKVTIEGIILNKPEYMVELNTEWQIYIQGEGTDHAGTAVYMRKNNWSGDYYSQQMWESELLRVSHDPNGNYEFQPGDRVRVTGLLMFHNGKTNINEKHSTSPLADFTINLIDPGAGLPQPEVITLNTIVTEPNVPIFDNTRAIGCEKYQSMLVRINDVTILGSNWGPGQIMEIQDVSGLRFNLILGKGEGFSKYPKPTGRVDVIGIFDQESTDYTKGYRIWVMNYDGNGRVLTDNCGLNGYFTGDINKDCEVNFTDFAEMAANWLKCSNLSYNECTIP